jgi:hypothetical protein
VITNLAGLDPGVDGDQGDHGADREQRRPGEQA